MQDYIDANADRFIEELKDYIRRPSISAKSEHKQDVLDTADFLVDAFDKLGFEAELCQTAGFPIVFAQKIVDPSLPTVLVYGHYDVQPPEPLELWKSPAFEPEVRDGNLYARGADDNKGQFWGQFKAMEVLQENGGLPCNVKFIVEGEEEVGSDNLPIFLEQNPEKLACDTVILSDTTMISEEIPSITTGLRGLSYVEIEVTGPKRDLHSGLYGGAVKNPINALCEMVAKLHDENGRVTIPGFYDRVAEATPEEMAAMEAIPITEETYKDSLHVADTYGEKGFAALARVTVRPTLDVNGIWGGYTGEGAKTVIASKAYAKISMRLVPDQSSDEVTEMFAKHFESIAPKGVTVKVTPHHGGEPAVTPIDSVAYQAAAEAYEAGFGVRPLPVRGGGSIPIVGFFKKTLGTDAILMGFGLDSNSIHSPNEHMSVSIILKGIRTVAEFYRLYAEKMKG